MNENVVLAPVSRRILARLFDILFFVGFLVTFFWIITINLETSIVVVNLLTNLLAFVFFLFYFVLFPLFFNGQTLGKKIWSIKLIFLQQKSKSTMLWNLFVRELYIMFAPLLLAWIFYGLYLLLFVVFLKKVVDQLQFLARTSVIFLIWWIFLFLFIKIETKHQLFYDRWLNILIVDLKGFKNKLSTKPVLTEKKKQLVDQESYDSSLSGLDPFLNTEQKAAVFANPETNLRIIAGPGTGKTTVLINRIIFFLKHLHIHPSQILTLTFTRKACQNIKDRVAKISSLQNSRAFPVFTYHGFCYWFLTVQEQKKVNVLDQSDQRQIIKTLLVQNPDLSQQTVDKQLVREVTDVINLLQQKKISLLDDFLKMKTTSDFLLSLHQKNKEQIWDLYQNYLQYKEKEQLFDFVDLLTKTYQILLDKPDTLTKLRKRYLYLAVDEFQDTNALQFDLIKLLTDSGTKIKTTVVGDPDQTIYGWRGSKIDFILNFQDHFKSLNTVTLVDNYRSQQNIVALANQIIAKNKQRIAKEIVAIKQATDKVVVKLDFSSFTTAFFIVYHIQKLLNQNVQANEIVVLYRVNYLSAILERLLLEKNIPYHIYKGQEFFKRKEIKDLLTLMRILVEPRDIYWEIVLSWIKGIGPHTIANLKKNAVATDKSIFAYLSADIPFFLYRYREQISHLLDTFHQLNQKLSQITSLKVLLQELFKQIYQPILMNSLDYEQRLKNIDVLIEQVATGFEQNQLDLSMPEKIRNFLAQTQLSAADDLSTEQKQRIKLMTIHNAKGLEFDYVFIFDVSGNNFPNLQRKNKNLEEERRLFFVATTRGRKGLYITGSSYEPSPFVQEIVKSAVVEIE